MYLLISTSGAHLSLFLMTTSLAPEYTCKCRTKRRATTRVEDKVASAGQIDKYDYNLQDIVQPNRDVWERIQQVM